MFINWTSLVS